MDTRLFRFFRKLPFIGVFFRYDAFTYIFFGVLTTAVNWGAFRIARSLFLWNTAVSTTFAWIVAFLFAYIVNKVFVFQSKKHRFGEVLLEFSLFFTARILSFGFDLGFMIISVDHFHMQDDLAKLLANVFVVFMNFFASKFVIFRKKTN